MILSFGPELTWLYAYLTADRDTVRSAKLRVSVPGREEVLTDDTFPFEFSLPMKARETGADLTFESMSASGDSKKSEIVRLGRD